MTYLSQVFRIESFEVNFTMGPPCGSTNLAGVFKNQIDWIPLSLDAVRPTQGRTLAVMQVSGGSLSI